MRSPNKGTTVSRKTNDGNGSDEEDGGEIMTNMARKKL
jgi:hypothetical protein